MATGLGKEYFTVVLNLCSEVQLEDSADFASDYRGSSVRYRPGRGWSNPERTANPELSLYSLKPLGCINHSWREVTLQDSLLKYDGTRVSRKTRRVKVHSRQ